jgi:4-amino-4-deoxy-L-arabinose transferase-like glycosyltransferase
MMLDSLFTLLFLLTLCCFYLGYEKEEGRRQYYLSAGLFMGLGVLTKGPVAYLTLPIFLIFAFSQRGLRKFWGYDLLLGCLLSLTVVLAWLIPGCVVGGEEYTKRILLKQMVGRLAGSMRHFHPEPFLFYFPRFSVEFLPWIVFLPTAFVLAFRREEASRRKELLFLSVWFIFVFVFFTFIKGKKDNYILPLYPAAAILLGWFWDRLIPSQAREKGVIAGLLLLVCLVLVAFGLFFVGFPEKSYPPLIPYRFLVFSILSYLLIGLSASLLCFIRRKKKASFVCLVVTFAILHLHISYSLPPRLNAERSMRGFSEKILKRMEVGDELKSCFFSPPGLIYYTGRPMIEEIKSDERFFEILRSPRRVFMVMRKRDLNRIQKDSKIEVEPIDHEKVGSSDLVLILNRRE